MLRTETHGPITRIIMAKAVAGRAIYKVSAFLIGDTLIDSGCPVTARELVDWCRERDVRRVVNTHYHEDHTGGNALLARELGVEVFAPPKSIPILAHFYRLPLYRRFTWGQPADYEPRPLAAECVVGGYVFKVVPTPGHADDHVCLFQPEKGWLFSGDLYISERAHYLRKVEDAWCILASLSKVLALSPRLLACSHAGFLVDAPGALRAKIHYWESLARRAGELRRQGLGLRAVTRRLIGAEGFLTWFSAGDFSKINLIRSLLREPERNPALRAAQPCVHGSGQA
jgi:glyoxylase-like metal-dependent hydrolase (beta-lactamase superfamily II)